MERDGLGRSAADADGATTVQPERDLMPGDPNLTGAAAPEEKKGIKGRVKGLMRRHGRKKDHGAQSAPGVTGKIGGKVSHKVGHGGDGEKHGPTRFLSMSSSSSSMSSSDEEDIGTVGHALDPTGPAVAGHDLGRKDFTSAPAGPGADFSDLSLKPNANGAVERHARRAAELAKWSIPMSHNDTESRDEHHHSHPIERGNSNESGRGDARYGGVDGHSHSTEAGNLNSAPREDAQIGRPSHLSRPTTETGDSNGTASLGEPHPGNPTGSTNSEGGAVLGDHHGHDLHEGRRDDNGKQEGFLSKVIGYVS